MSFGSSKGQRLIGVSSCIFLLTLKESGLLDLPVEIMTQSRLTDLGEVLKFLFIFHFY